MPSPDQLRATIAGKVSRGDEDGAREARTEYYTEWLARKIEETVAKAPPLKPEQIERLRALLTPSAAPAPSKTSEAA